MKKSLSIIILVIIFIGSAGCNKNKPDNYKTLKKLYKDYKNGEINECIYNGEVVYSVGLNAHDAGNAIFDKDGTSIGDCNYAWGTVDNICGELQNCEVIYRVEDNIWGTPAVDVYGLGD